MGKASKVTDSKTFDQWREETNNLVDDTQSNESDIGDTSNLETTDKSNLVNAVNEVKDDVTNVEAIAAGGNNVIATSIALG